VHTVTHSTGNDAVYSLTVGASTHFTMSGGSLEILTTATFSDSYTQTGGTLLAGAVSITGTGTLTGGASEGSTSFTISGTTALANYLFGGASEITNSNITNQTGGITLGDNTGANATINNGTNGNWNIAGDYGINQGAASAVFNNHGSITKTAGSGTSEIAVSVTTNTTSKISAASGNLEFAGPTNAIAGSLTGAGEISFAAGVTSLTAPTLTVAEIGIYNAATVNLGRSLSYGGIFSDLSSGTSTLNLGASTLTLTSASSDAFEGSFGNAFVTGSGGLTLQGATTLSNAQFGGTLNVTNSGTITEVATVTFADGSGNVPTFTNTSAGTYVFSNDSNLGEDNGTVAFTNKGTIKKTGLNGTSDISLATTNSGTISAQSGTLEFDNSLVNTGVLSGAGALEMGNGVATFNAGTSLTVATFDLFNSSTLNLGTSLSYAGVFNDSSSGNDYLNLGAYTFNLTGYSDNLYGSFGSVNVSGTGSLVVYGRLSLSNVVFGGTMTFQDNNSVLQTGAVTLGNGNGLSPQVNIASGKFWNITTNSNIGLNAGSGAILNQGTLEKTGGGGGSDISAVTTNSATIAINSGTLEFDNALINSGTVSGTGALEIGGGTTTFNSGSVLSIATIELYNAATLALGASLTYANTFNDSSGGNDYIALGANTLTLTGSQNNLYGSFGVTDIEGSGTLANQGKTSVSNLQIDNTATFNNTGTVDQVGGVTIGGGAGQVAEILNGGNGVWDLVNNYNINTGASHSSAFVNNGLFEQTAGTGTSVVYSLFQNNGVLTVSSGTVEFVAGAYSGAGTINGTVSYDNSGDMFVTKASA